MADLSRASSILNDYRHIAQTQLAASETLEALGESAEAWEYRYRALELESRASGRQRPVLVQALKGASRASLAEGQILAALDFQDELVWETEGPRIDSADLSAVLGRARIETAIGRQDLAKLDLDRSIRKLSGVTDPATRRRFAADIDLVSREISAPEKRAAEIAEDLARNPGTDSPALMNASADLDLRRGDITGAEGKLLRALDEVERQGVKLKQGKNQTSFFDRAQPLYQRLVALDLNTGRPEEALQALERFRSRTLLDQLKSALTHGGRVAPASSSREKGAPLHWTEICQRIPENTAVVVYDVIDGQLVTWMVRPTGIERSENQAWSSVSARIQRLDATSGRRSSEIEQTLEELYSLLVDPWKERLAPEDRILFVPTGLLYKVPFAALRSPKSGRFLIEEHALGLAPSASGFVTAVERDESIETGPPVKALLVGNPAMESRSYPQLSQLAGSEREIKLLSEVYGRSSTVLTGGQANPTRVISALREAEVAHLSVHAMQDAKDPARSRLVLAPTKSASGDLSIRDILGLRLNKTRLVMLAACETQAGPVSASEGALSIASSFLAAGVPAVVGSLRQVDDQSTARISVRFHRELRAGADALTALRAAQIEEIQRLAGRFDWTWASFQVIGGVAERHPDKPVQGEPGLISTQM